MCESLQSTASSQHRSLGPRNLCGTGSSHRHVRHGSRAAFSVPSRRTCRQGHTTRAVPTKTEELKPGVETAEGLRLAMEPIGPVKHLGYALATLQPAGPKFCAHLFFLAPTGFQRTSRSTIEWAKRLAKGLGLQFTQQLN